MIGRRLTMQGDPELKAMGEVLEALSPLERDMQLRVLQWVASKLDISAPHHPPRMTPIESSGEGSGPRKLREGTVSTVAIKLGADSCRTLMLAAAVHLSLYQDKDAFSRADWIACAKEARAWRNDYGGQLPTIIGRLLGSGVIFEKSKDVFSMDASALSEYEAKLAAG